MPFDNLNVSPLIAALKDQPEDFVLQGTPSDGVLVHPKSRHEFRIWPEGKVAINAYCGCTYVQISQESSDEIRSTVADWNEQHWAPHVARVGVACAMSEVEGLRTRQYLDSYLLVRQRDGGVDDHFAEHFQPTPEQVLRKQQREAAAAAVVAEAARIQQDTEVAVVRVSALAALRHRLADWINDRKHGPSAMPAFGGGDD